MRCIRLVVADFVPSAPFEAKINQVDGDRENGSGVKNKYDQRCDIYFRCFYTTCLLKGTYIENGDVLDTRTFWYSFCIVLGELITASVDCKNMTLNVIAKTFICIVD